MAISTVFTLFVVPAIYVLLAGRRQAHVNTEESESEPGQMRELELAAS
jgi:hypothetical protein